MMLRAASFRVQRLNGEALSPGLHYSFVYIGMRSENQQTTSRYVTHTNEIPLQLQAGWSVIQLHAPEKRLYRQRSAMATGCVTT